MPNNREVDKDAIVFRDDLELVLPMTKLNPLETHEAVVPAAQVMVHQVFQDDKGTMASKVDPYAHGDNSSSDLKVLHPCADSININNKVWNMYFRDLLPRLVKAGDDGNCGLAAVCDTLCLQVLSKRIHYGKFVAEAKFREYPTAYEDAIRAQDRAQLMELLTYETVEATIKKRVEMKAKTFGQDVTVNQEEDVVDPVYKIKPSLVASLYGEWIIPLTKPAQVEYLLRRLD
ncbi:chorismate mutase 3, chloroplastic-like [Castanea sativa]|uniref:chorismate mutase 3, chloroplastic-like n=1 Tax=Castanea sativa TaxID=21020 RepID=UPI003F64CDD2